MGEPEAKTGGAEDADKKDIESDEVVLLLINDATLGETGVSGGALPTRAQGAQLTSVRGNEQLLVLDNWWGQPSCEGGDRPSMGDPAPRIQASGHLLVSRAVWPGVRQRRHM